MSNIMKIAQELAKSTELTSMLENGITVKDLPKLALNLFLKYKKSIPGIIITLAEITTIVIQYVDYYKKRKAAMKMLNEEALKSLEPTDEMKI